MLLVFANKQDLHDSLSAAEISHALDLSSIKDHTWHIQVSEMLAVSCYHVARMVESPFPTLSLSLLQPCCALTGDGLKEGMEWLSKKVPK